MLLASWVMMGSLGAGNAEAANPVAAPGKLHMGRRVQTARSGDASDSAAQLPCNLELGFRVTTGPRGWAFGEFRDRTTFEMIPLTRMMVESDAKQTNRFVVRLDQGELYVISRGGGSSIPFRTAYAEGVAKGTEYVLSVDPTANELRVVMLDGEVELRRDGEVQTVRSGQLGVVGQGRTIEVTSLRAANVIQWWIDFPVVLDSDDLPLDDTARARLAASITAYRHGNLELALDLLPEAGDARSAAVAVGEAERVYRAAVLLAAGEVAEARRWLGNPEASTQIGEPLRILLRALTHPLIAGTDTGETAVSAVDERSASDWLALSFFEQSRHRLDGALEAARRASLKAPRFGAVWARLAELEFGAGRHGKARTALGRAMELSPESAAVWALDGFVKASLGEMRAARKSFERAIELDPRHANGWLGRGLCRIRAGDAEGGGEDLRIAAALDPDRSLMRSYAGKAFAQAGESKRARQEWDYARVLDDADPTPWLYSALERAAGNEVNEALRELGESMRRNDNRAVYRSRELLDEDRAIRGANLALMYQDAGLEDFAEREATRAVEADYTQAAAHLFLANSYDALRDPRQVNLRYESPWYSEYLLANLLSPVGASPLSPTVSQQEYTRLFEKEGPGLVNRTVWTSNGDWLERAAQFGRWGNFAYSLDADYRSNRGWRGNEDQEQLTLTATVKQQVGPDDSVWAQVTYYDAESGDVRQLMDPGEHQAGYRFDERLAPMALAGWHHRWSADSSTLMLLGGWSSSISLTNPSARLLTVTRDLNGESDRYSVERPTEYSSQFSGGSLEIQHIQVTGDHTLVAGARGQLGRFDTEAVVTTDDLYDYDPTWRSPSRHAATPDFGRASLYLYDTWHPLRWLWVTGGLTYDHLRHPENYLSPPMDSSEESLDRLLPKIGFGVSPWTNAMVRGVYIRSLGGVSLDQSVRLEPVQVAGFNQAYRGLLPDAKLGSVAAQEMEVRGISFDQWVSPSTFVTLAVEELRSEAEPGRGGYLYDNRSNQVRETQVGASENYEERSLTASLGQLAGEWLAFNARYRLSASEWTEDMEVPELGSAGARQSAVLHELTLGARFHHRRGWFARWETRWCRQTRSDGGRDLLGDEFWQHDLWVGWRQAQRRVEVAAGLLNITDQNYRLDPVSYYMEQPRERMLALDLRFQF